MKIAYLLQEGVPELRKCPLNGPANHVKQVVTELGAMGHQVRVLASMDGRLWITDDLVRFQPIRRGWEDGIPVRLFEKAIRFVQGTIKLPYAALFNSIRFALACGREFQGYDLFYERMGWMGYGAGLAARSMHIPLVLEVNGDHLNELFLQGKMPGKIQLWLSLLIMEAAAKLPAFVIASGDGHRKSYIDRWGIQPEKICTIENGTEVVGLLRRDQLRSFQPEKSDSEKVHLIYVGSFEPWHGLEIAIHTVKRLISEGHILELTIVGDGTLRSKIVSLIQEESLDMAISLTGALTMRETAIQLARADIGLAPYCGWSEFSGLKLLDYKAAGLATVVSGENGQPKIISHGITGFIVPPCCPDELAAAISLLCRNVELRRQIGRQARLEAEVQHSWGHTARELDQVFRKIVQAG